MADKVKQKTFKMIDADEAKTTKGTSFIIYGDSASRKTRSLGSMGTNSATLHIELDGGTNSATDAMRSLGIEGAVHKIANPSSLGELNDIIIALHTNKFYRDNIDCVVIDNLVVIADWVKDFVASTPRYKTDMLSVEDATNDDTKKSAAGTKVMAFYGEVQKLTKGLVNQLLELKDCYNVFMLAGAVDSVDAAGSPVTMPLVNGPRSILPVVSIFDECYRTSFKEGDFDTPDHVATFFNMSTFTNQLTGMQYFGKTRNIKTMDYLKANKIPADFDHILTKEIGYVYKKDRIKPKE